MLFLQIPLLAVLLAGGDNEDAFQERISFHVIYTLFSYNHSSALSWSSGWLDEVQIHGWERNSGSIIFRWSWSKSNFSNKEMTELEVFFREVQFRVQQIFRNHASQWNFEYPFDVQITAGCERHPGGAMVDFIRFAYQGSDLMSFQDKSWLPSLKNDTRAQQVCTQFNQYHLTNEILHRLFSDTCPRFLLGLLDAGKADLRRQVKPEAWLSTGPHPGPDRQMLVCHVSSFHPKPIWVKWMRGEQVQQGTQPSDILPNADGTWYLQVLLDVEATETSGLSCRVRHSSLEGQDIVLYLATGRHNSMGFIILAVMVPLMLLTGLAFWLKKRWTHCEPPPTLLPME